MNDFAAGTPTDRLPTLVRTRRGYRVHDPALTAGTRWVVDDAGDLVYTRVPAGTVTVTSFAAAAVTAVAVGHNSWSWSLLMFAIALPSFLVVALALLSLVHAATDPVRAYRRRAGHGRYAVDVTDRAGTGWQLCVRAERLAATRSWQYGLVDPDRTLPGLLWMAVGAGGIAAAGELNDLTEPATGPDLTSV